MDGGYRFNKDNQHSFRVCHAEEICCGAYDDEQGDGRAAFHVSADIINNPFMIWGRYRKKLFRYYLPISFQFHHTQMDGAHAGRFLANLQNEIKQLR